MSVLENLNYIKEASYFPCAQPDPVLYIEAAFTALGPAIWEAATFSCVDLVRLRAGISPWHVRGLKALINGINPPAIQDKVNNLYKFIIPAERLLHYMFIADLATGFVANWQSQIFKLGGCDNTPHGCTFSGSHPTWVSTSPDFYAFVAYQIEPASELCPGVDGTRWIVNPGQYWTASFDFVPKPIFVGDQVGSVDTRIATVGGIGPQFEPTNFTAPWYGNTIKAIYKRHGHNTRAHAQTFEFQAKSDRPAFAESGHCYVSISDAPLRNEGILPVNCLGQFVQPPL